MCSGRPVAARLLSNPNLRARYLGHVRTIVDEWLNWETLGPLFEDYRALIAEEVLADTHNVSTFAGFFDADNAEPSGGDPFGGSPGIRQFVDARRAYLLKHSELAKSHPTILSLARPAAAEAKKPVRITAQVAEEVPVEAVLLHFAMGVIMVHCGYSPALPKRTTQNVPCKLTGKTSRSGGRRNDVCCEIRSERLRDRDASELQVAMLRPGDAALCAEHPRVSYERR